MPLAAAGSLHPISGKLIRRLARRSQHRLLRAVLLFHDVPGLLIDGNGGSFFLRIRGVGTINRIRRFRLRVEIGPPLWYTYPDT